MSPAQPVPRFLTRAELYDAFHARIPSAPRRLTAFERDALAQAAARRAAENEPDLAFRLRPGLVAEMLRFYDQLRRQSQQVKRFEELIADALGGAVSDRGASRLLAQTRFLAHAFREYERSAVESGACDEHMLRARLLEEAAADPLRRIVVSVGDWIADPAGLYVADFDLLARVPNLETIDLVCTERVLASGLHERVHSWWPGLEEVEASVFLEGGARFAPPMLLTPAADQNEQWFTFRDREDEIADVGRRFLLREPDRTAIVFKHPLPYLYMAPGTLGAAGLTYRTFDGLPLAAEPVAAAVDAVLDIVESGFTRGALVALLRSPHFRFADADESVSPEEVSALSGALSSARYLGDLERLEAIQLEKPTRALGVATRVSKELAPLAVPAPASAQLQRLAVFLTSSFRPLEESDPFAAREARGREAILDLLAGLTAAQAAFHDPDWTIAELAGSVRRWISEQTFAPDLRGPSGPGIDLVDDQAARYGDFDEVVVVGLVEHEWPERTHRNIFFGASLLKALGWPSEKDRRGAADARFLDLVRSASSRVLLSTFTLDDESLVTRSTQLDETPRARLSSVPIDALERRARASDPSARGWADIRTTRSPADAEAYHGRIGTVPPRDWSVSALETYLGCPFKFFAQHVLRLQEEPDDEEVMDPRRQGQFVHEVFERFFAEWQKGGGRGITPQNLQDARVLFVDVVERSLARLPDAEGGLERTRLLGSPAAAGLGEAVFRMEAERPVAVVERLLEEKLEGEFRIVTADGPRTIRLRGKADRLDLLEDGTFRLIDYKLGTPPSRSRALQLPIYALCAEQRLAGRHGKTWTLGEAAYLAFKGTRRVVPLFADAADKHDALASAQQRLADTIDAIERGEFPPTPDDVFRCEMCSFAAVCRKDYV
jgi:ATP-dependent helicase/nuclease subunit B